MPKRRRAQRARYTWDGDVWNAALDLATWETYWGGPAEGRAAWQRLRDRYRGHLGDRPAPFWAYEDVPAALRADPPDADPRLGEDDPQFQRARLSELAVELGRLRWLLSGGQDSLRDGETPVIVARIEADERERDALQCNMEA